MVARCALLSAFVLLGNVSPALAVDWLKSDAAPHVQLWPLPTAVASEETSSASQAGSSPTPATLWEPLPAPSAPSATESAGSPLLSFQDAQAVGAPLPAPPPSVEEAPAPLVPPAASPLVELVTATTAPAAAPAAAPVAAPAAAAAPVAAPAAEPAAATSHASGSAWRSRTSGEAGASGNAAVGPSAAPASAGGMAVTGSPSSSEAALQDNYRTMHLNYISLAAYPQAVCGDGSPGA